MMVYSLTNSVNFPAKNLDRGRFFYLVKKRVKTIQNHLHYCALSGIRPKIIIVSLRVEVTQYPFGNNCNILSQNLLVLEPSLQEQRSKD